MCSHFGQVASSLEHFIVRSSHRRLHSEDHWLRAYRKNNAVIIPTPAGFAFTGSFVLLGFVISSNLVCWTITDRSARQAIKVTLGIAPRLRWVHQSPSGHCGRRPLDGSLSKKGTNSNRTVAKFGIAPDFGSGGRGFESHRKMVP